MNWHAVRRTNAIRSQKKARREAAEASRKVRIERAGGPVTLEELKTAPRRMEKAVYGFHDREVWTFRGKDWRVEGMDGHYAAYPFVSYRQDVQLSEFVPLTTAAKKYMASIREMEGQQ